MDSLVVSAVRLPEAAAKVAERSDLPSPAQRLAIRAEKTRAQWRAWRASTGVILLIAEYISPPHTHPKAPTLRLSLYGTHGRVKDRSEWLYLPRGIWQRLPSNH